jgi:gamma-glutamylcyclotransferase (GGCT)/AIG2-like uncharacterized protein YtfP
MTMNRIFIYGTLKRGFRLNRVLEDSTFEGPAVMEAAYRMVGQGVPALVPAAATNRIAGEVYLVNDEVLVLLDKIEAAYRREQAWVGGKEAWVYVGRRNWACTPPVEPRADGVTEWRRR